MRKKQTRYQNDCNTHKQVNTYFTLHYSTAPGTNWDRTTCILAVIA